MNKTYVFGKTSVFPRCISKKPVHQLVDCDCLQTGLVVTYRVHIARIVFSAAHGDAEYTRRTVLCIARITAMRL